MLIISCQFIITWSVGLDVYFLFLKITYIYVSIPGFPPSTTAGRRAATTGRNCEEKRAILRQKTIRRSCASKGILRFPIHCAYSFLEKKKNRENGTIQPRIEVEQDQELQPLQMEKEQ